jgi:hypothetical protein
VQVLAETPVLDVSGSCQIMTQARNVDHFMTDKLLALKSAEIMLLGHEGLLGGDRDDRIFLRNPESR